MALVRPRTNAVLYALLGTVCAASDLISKHLVFRWRGNPIQHNEWWIVEGFFGVETSLNNGALFGMGQGLQYVFAAMSLVALSGICWWLFRVNGLDDRWLTVALALVSGGIIGNLVDRLGLDKLADTPPGYQHAVRDWILFRFGDFTWPNFNLADSYLVCGAIMLMGHALWLDRHEDK
ncbi:MAG: signal peptidase II [Planctomycetales bacterium]|nr:signal peptidase II [Planctomycetales bacterium]